MSGTAIMAEAPDINVPAQEGLIGCALLGAAGEISAKGINVDSFVDGNCRKAWTAIDRLLNSNHQVSSSTVLMEAKTLDPYWLTACEEKAPTQFNWSYHLPAVLDVSHRFHLWRVSADACKLAASNQPAEEILATLEVGINKLPANDEIKEIRADGWKEVCDIVSLAGTPSAIGLQTGISDIDKIVRGYRKGTMNTVAARPGEGKSAYAANIAMNAAKDGKRVLVFSAEMPARDYQLRLLAIDSGQDVQSFLHHGWEKVAYSLAASIQRISSLPIGIIDNQSITASQIICGIPGAAGFRGRAEPRRLPSRDPPRCERRRRLGGAKPPSVGAGGGGGTVDRVMLRRWRSPR